MRPEVRDQVLAVGGDVVASGLMAWEDLINEDVLSRGGGQGRKPQHRN